MIPQRRHQRAFGIRWHSR